MKISKYKPADLSRMIHKRASPGEKIIGKLFPNRHAGYPGGWSQDRIEQVMHLKNWTYVTIDAIASILAQLMPNMAYVRHKDPKKHVEKGWVDTPWRDRELTFQGGRFSIPSYYAKSLAPTKPHEELEPLEHDHLLRRLIEDPNPIDTSFDLLYEMDMFLELCGVAYWWIIPNAFGTPCEIWTIPSHWVWPRSGDRRYIEPDHPAADQLIEYYEIRPWGGLGSAGTLKFPATEVLMFNWKSPLNKIDGYSKLSAIAQWVDTEESIGKSRWAQMINQARPELWVELDETFNDPDDDRLARIEAKFMAKYQGEFNYAKPLFTPSGSKVTPLSFNPTEMAYFQSADQIRDMILSAFRVPGAAVGLTKDMTYGSILAALAALCTFCVNPRLVMLGQRLTKFLATRFSTPEDPIRIWWDDATPPDPSQVNADIQLDWTCQSISPNEIRAIRGRRPFRTKYADEPFGGSAPIPLNTGKDMTKLGPLVPRLGEPEMPEGGAPGMDPNAALPPGIAPPAAGGPPPGVPPAAPGPGPDGQPTPPSGDLVPPPPPGPGPKIGIENPNGPPQKRWQWKASERQPIKKRPKPSKNGSR